MKNILLTLSVLINIGLIIFLCVRMNAMNPPNSNLTADSSKENVAAHDYEIASMNNFKAVYLNRNDSVYKSLWNEAFENQPQSAFLISCSYFYVTKDTSILKDIEMSVSQLQDVYQRKFEIKTDSL